MKITVAVACYNQEDKIEKCLESIIGQDYENLEVLIVDDHSTDNSLGVITHFSDSHPEKDIHVISHERNMGISQNRNTALGSAKGECIFFIDGDDYIEPNTISRLYRKMRDTGGADVVCPSFRMVDLEGRTIREYIYPEEIVHSEFAMAKYIEKYILDTNRYFPMFVTTKLYRTAFLKDNNIIANPECLHLGEDYIFTLQVIFNAQKIAFISDVTHNWVQHSESITNQRVIDHDGFYRIKKVLELAIKEYADQKLKYNSKQIPKGLLYVVNNICLTDGHIKRAISANVTIKEKKVFLKGLKTLYKRNGLIWHNVVGVYNRLSYLILISPFPYILFTFYFRHLNIIIRIVKLFS